MMREAEERYRSQHGSCEAHDIQIQARKSSTPRRRVTRGDGGGRKSGEGLEHVGVD